MANEQQQELAQTREQRYSELQERHREMREKATALGNEMNELNRQGREIERDAASIYEEARRDVVRQRNVDPQTLAAGDVVEDEFGVRYRVYNVESQGYNEVQGFRVSYGGEFPPLMTKPITVESATRVYGIRLSKNGVEQHSNPRLIGSPNITKVDLDAL